MKHSLHALVIFGTLISAVHATPNDGIVGAHLRIEVGRSNFGVSTALPQVSSDDHGKAVKFFGGYRFDEKFALHGRLGLSSGKVSGTTVLPLGDSLMGKRTSVWLGLGADYRPWANIALTLNDDHHGRLSTKVKASALVVGFHFTL